MPATFVPIHAAGDGAWSWHLVGDELRRLGHDVVAIDLPEGQGPGLRDYAETVADAIRGHEHVVVVAHSFGAFTAPIVCALRPVELLVYIAGMVPAPGETPADWWDNTGYAAGRRAAGMKDEDDLATYYHDVPADLAAEAMRRARDHPSQRAYGEPWPLAALPAVPSRFLLCRQDRLFPAEWSRRLAHDRLGIEADEIDTGHCPNLAQPAELARRLDAYVAARDEGRV